MDAKQACAIPRHPREIERLIRSREQSLTYLRDLAADFAATDIRPFYWHDGQITYTRPLNIPKDLLDMIHAEAQAIAELRAELHG